MATRLFLPILLSVVALAGFVGYQWARSSVAKSIYRERLVGLQQDYADLATQYNQAVTPRPVTELLVEGGVVSVVVRKGGGETVTIPTPFNAWQNDVYVDYLLVDGRLLIRRVFEIVEGQTTSKPVVIDGDLVKVDWEALKIPYGKAIYRGQMADGRWVISVTGDGSLGLKKVDDTTEVDLITQPQVKEYDPVDEQAHDQVESIGVGDVWRHLVD